MGSRCQLDPVFNYHLSPSTAVKVGQLNQTWDLVLSINQAITTVGQDIPTVRNLDDVNPLIDFVFTNCTFSHYTSEVSSYTELG